MDLVFIKLLNMSISASWLVLAVIVLRFLLKKSPKWIHVALWALVAVRLLCPFSIESAMSLIPSGETIPETIIYAQTPAIDSGVEVIDQAVNASMAESLTPQAGASVNPVQVHLFVQENIWCLGMVFMLGWAIISYFRIKKKVSASIDLGNGIYICDYIATPFILGIVKPKIYLPSTMEPDSASHVLAHECSHIARKDHWWKPFGYLLLTVHWFNPVLWLAYILLCRDIELACDEKVIRNMEAGQKKAYSEALLKCSVNRRYVAACPLAFGEVGVKERVKTVLNYKKPAFWIVLIAILALIVTAICFLTDPVTEGSIPNGALKDPYELNWIYWTQYMELEHTGILEYVEYGATHKAEVTYDGTSYTISDEKGKRKYGYCVKDQAPSGRDEVIEYFFLTDDPEMTAERYLNDRNILPTEVLYVDRKTFAGAESYGEVPKSVEEILNLEQTSWIRWYCPESMFAISTKLVYNSVREACMVNRYDYDGKLLCEFDIKGIPQTILELKDGGFAAFAASETDGLYSFTCYDESGNLRWKYTPEEGGSKYVPFMYQRDGDIYCFGTVTPRSLSSDLYIWRIGQDGKLVEKIKIGGSDFDSIHRVLETENGFEILGSTQSRDGDLPFSVDGYGVDFRLEINPELEMLSKEKWKNTYYAHLGFHDGKPVFADDLILKISGKDRFPDDLDFHHAHIFDWEDGHVILRTLSYMAYPYGHPLVSMQTYYTQMVITGYDAKGNPQWQLAGNVRTG